MTTITIRDKQPDSDYVVLVTTNSTAYSAYNTVEEFMDEFRDTLAAMKVNLLSFSSQESIVLTADYTLGTVYVYSKELGEIIKAGARPCELLSNGTKRPGAILVDSANKQTTFFRLNPNDREQ